MGGFELLIWIAIIIFSLIRGVQSSKKRQNTEADSGSGESSDPFQDAIREIEAALRGESLQPNDETVAPPGPSKSQTAEPEIENPSRLERHEPEFHSMESNIPDRSLESRTTFKERYIEKPLETGITYEDEFPSYTYFDDEFQHAHPNEIEVLSTKTRVTDNKLKESLEKRLKNKDDLKEAIVLQEILNRRFGRRPGGF